MSELSSDDLVAIVGPIGEAAMAEIIGTGISKMSWSRPTSAPGRTGVNRDRHVIEAKPHYCLP